MSHSALLYLGTGIVSLGGAAILWKVFESRTKKIEPGGRYMGGGGDPSAVNYSSQDEMRSVLFGGGPSDLKALRDQARERRKRLGEAYARAEYERVLKIQLEERKMEASAKK